MAFKSSSWLPYTVGSLLVACGLLAGALGWLSNLLAGCLFMPGILLVLDASFGTRALSYYFFSKHPFTHERVEEIFFSQSNAFPRFFIAICFCGTFAVVVNLFHSEVVTAVGLVACIVGYSLLASVGLVRSISQAHLEASSPKP